MADEVSLENLIEGLAGAVVEAQQRIESRQIENFLSFFDRDKRPKTFDILLPSLYPEAKDKEKDKDVRYRVPLLPLVASTLLRIKEVEISFDADLVRLSEEENEKDNTKGDMAKEGETAEGAAKRKSVTVEMRGAGVFRKKVGAVHVILKVEGRELSEGLARVVDRLIQVQGDVD
jgi:hypothetical protein